MKTRAAATRFEDLIVWQKAHEFVLSVYKYSEGFPRQEEFALKSQLRKAAISIPANIAEGFRRRGRADKARFINMSEASSDECCYYLILSRDLGYGNPAELLAKLEEVSKILRAYASSLLAPNS